MVELDGKSLTIEGLILGAKEGVKIAKGVLTRLEKTRRALEERAKTEAIYGYNTGVGKLAEVRLRDDALREFQLNLLRSHAAGVGELLPWEEARALWVLRLNGLLSGRSGVRPQLARALEALINTDLAPAVPKMGSVGASGDLAPLAHAALPLVGEGEVITREGRKLPSLVALRERGIEPVRLEAREALALTNGTQFSAVLLAYAIAEAEELLAAADGVCALSFWAIGARPEQFEEGVLSARPHPGQLRSGRRISRLLAGMKPRGRVQDAYSLRCAPQVHGAALDALRWAKELIERELNSATDNPLVLDDGRVLPGGNFHGAPLALAADALGIALVPVAAISERRSFRLLTPELGAPTAFLTPEPGLGSGFMMLGVSQASLLARARVLAHPASVDSVPTSGGQEDHVSMSAPAAQKLREILGLVRLVLAAELLMALQAIHLAGLEEGMPPGLAELYQDLREKVGIKPLVQDRPLGPELEGVGLRGLSRVGELVLKTEGG